MVLNMVMEPVVPSEAQLAASAVEVVVVIASCLV